MPKKVTKITKSWCETHSQAFRTFDDLNRHIRDSHIDLTCYKCGRLFPNETAFRLHNRANHNNDQSVNK